MTDYPLISIAMTTYNGEKYLQKQLDSIYNQTYKNVEVIVTDDCSTDSTVHILEEYARQFGLKYFVNEQNLGFVKNFEKAISLCSGEYIALSDQDDIWLPEKLETLINEINEYSLAFSDISLINNNGDLIVKSFKSISKNLANTQTPAILLCFNKIIYGCTILFKQSLKNTIIPIPEGIGHHDWWIPIVASKSNGIKYVDKPLVLYRQHEGNLSGDIKNHIFFHKILRFFLQKHRNTIKRYRKLNRDAIKAILELHLNFDDTEKAILLDSIYYYDRFVNDQFSLKDAILITKYRNIFFSKNYLFLFEILSRIINFNIAFITRFIKYQSSGNS